MVDAIKASTSVLDLTGIGTEYLVSEDGTIIAKFYNGNFALDCPRGNLDQTIAA